MKLNQEEKDIILGINGVDVSNNHNCIVLPKIKDKIKNQEELTYGEMRALVLLLEDFTQDLGSVDHEDDIKNLEVIISKIRYSVNKKQNRMG